MIILTRTLAVCAFWLTLQTTIAQPEYDFQLRKSIELQKDLGKFQINLVDQVRLVDNANTFGQNLTEITFGYSPLDWLGASLAYRYSIRPDRNVHRISINLSTAYKVKKWRTTFALRLRGQWDRSDRSTDLSGYTLRPRFAIRYEPKGKFWKKWTFGIFGELFFDLHPSTAGFEAYRVGAEIDFELSKDASLMLRYFAANEVFGSRPDYDNVLQIGVTVNIPHKKKKKKDDKDDDKDKDDKDENNNRVLPNIHN